MAVLLHLLSQLTESVPLGLSVGLDCLEVVLLLCVFVRAFVKQLWVYFHEKLHRIVHHAVDSSVDAVSL